MESTENNINSQNTKKELTNFDIIKLIAVFLLVSFLVYRSFLSFRAEYAFREAYNAEAGKNHDLAIEKYLKAKRLAPWETHYQVQLGKIYENKAAQAPDKETKIAYMKKAEDTYLDCLKISPTNPWYQNRMAEIYKLYASVTDNAEAKAEFLRKREEKIKYASTLDPNNALFQMAVAYLYHQEADYETALEKYKHVLEIDDRFAEAYFNMADIYRRQGNEEKQIEMYQNIFEKKPDFKNAHLQLGRIYESKGRLDEAIDQYIEEVKIDKRNVVAYEMLGNALFRKKDWGNAAKVFKRLTILQNTNPRYYLLTAQAMANAKKIQEALKFLEEAQTYLPDNKDIANNIRNIKNLLYKPKPKSVAAPLSESTPANSPQSTGDN